MLVVLLFTSIGVWKSIVDPWGWFLDGSNVLFYPSAIIAAGALLLWGHDRRGRPGAGRDHDARRTYRLKL